MKAICVLFAAVVLMPKLATAADYNLGELAKANKIEVFNRKLDQTKADSPQAVFLNAAPNDGLAWIRRRNRNDEAMRFSISPYLSTIGANSGRVIPANMNSRSHPRSIRIRGSN